MKNFLRTIYFSFLCLGITSCIKTSPLKVLIQGFDNISKEELTLVQEHLSKELPKHQFVIADHNSNLPQKAYTDTKSPRYKAEIILEHLKLNIPSGFDQIIGITSKDICFSKRNNFGQIKEPSWKYKEWGIFGLATVPGKSCIISTFRIKNTSKEKYKDRLQKVCIHEFGHNLGLLHCSDNKCVMQDAVESIATVDKAQKCFCQKCTDKIN
jgi:archaemetzincin